MYKKFVFLSAITFLLVVKIHAQEKFPAISGIVTDTNDRPLAGISISLLLAGDSSVIKIVSSAKSGEFVLENINKGSYLLKFTSAGYEPAFSNIFVFESVNLKIPVTKLTESTKSLSAVTVTAKKPFVETKLDKTVVNVDASPTSAGSTALEILEKSPGITVDNDGTISLRGKQGVIIMLDGKPTYLSGADLANMLKNMPASALDQIEIMTNPSSRFDATGNSGVINIKTKKGRSAGFNGSLMVGFTTSIYKPGNTLYFMPRTQNSFNFNWRKNKINVFGNYNPNASSGRNIQDLEGQFIDANDAITGYNRTQSKFRFGNSNHSLKIGVDWYANKNNVFGVVFNGFTFSGHPTPNTVADLLNEHQQLQSRLVSHTDNDISFRNATINLNWKHNFDTLGKELSMDFDYVVYGNLSDMLLTTEFYNSSLQKTGSSALKGHLPSDIDIYSFKSDYVHPLKNGRFETGFKLSFVKNDNLVNYSRRVGDKWELDEIRSNHFIYDENINAAYVNYSRKLGKKWNMQAGLRIENTNVRGNQLGNSMVPQTKFRRDTTNLFPTAFVSYAANDKNTFTINYGRRINRPNYQDLNPFTFFLDSLSYRQGNIYLRPQYTNNFEISHSFRNKFITTVNFSMTDDVISQVIKLDPNDPDSQIRYLTVDNVSSFRNVGLSITAPVKFSKWWNANFFTNIYNNHYEGIYDALPITLEFTSFMFNITNNFDLGKGLSAEVSGFYRHKSLAGLTQMEPIYQVSAGIQKQVMKGKGTVRLNVRDPFAWQEFRGLNKYGRIHGSFHSRPDIRQVTGTFTWRFGNANNQNQPRKRNSGSADEQNRAGQGGQ